MENYVTLSLETHLFFARIMKEHSLFLEAGFPCKDETWIKRAEHFRQQFENLLRDVVNISNGKINNDILVSGELVTEFTIPAERRTQNLSGVSIDSNISMAQQCLRSGCSFNMDCETIQTINKINNRAICLLDGLIEFKENILREVSNCRLFTVNYPLLIKHILREAKLYRTTINELMNNQQLTYMFLRETEKFWNQIMMEHALFIRGLLDPSEADLIETADEFAMDYKKLLEMASERDYQAMDELTRQSLETTLEYRQFKTAGTEGILNCSIASIILPLLADHVLREANHYIRLLESCYEE